MIDCETFRNCEIDALYGELDAESSAAMTAHTATCADCSARLERLRKTRGLVLSVAVEAVPNDFESRIMAAVDAGMAKRASVIPIGRASAPAGTGVPAPKAEGGAKIFRFLSRPSFAVAATFLLLVSAGALVLVRSGTSLKSMAKNDESPSMQAAPMSPGLVPVPMPAEAPAASGALAEATATAAPTTFGVAPPVVQPQGPAGAVAMNDSSEMNGLPRSAPAAKAVAAAPAAVAAAPSKRKAGKASASDADDRAFAAARSLYNAGRYADALPKFNALSASNPEADLYAARCIAKTRGCAAAEARYDTAAQTNAGTETGSRAQLEGARCYQSTGDVVAARKRYQAAKDEALLENEAAKALEDLDHTGGGGGGSGGAHAAPKPAERAPEPAPASPPANR
ncbi:MAG: very large tegument protein [Myxococcaceae bacterium]|nr:very large tegument protein [Myxococcaceae bacterium]